MKFDKTAQQRFTDLYKRYYKLMYHVAFEVLHNRVTTEDVVPVSYTHLDVYKRQDLREEKKPKERSEKSS